MKKRKLSLNANKRNSSNTAALSNKSSSLEDNAQYYDKFLKTLQKSTHIKLKKSKDGKKSLPCKDIQIIDVFSESQPQPFNKIVKKEFGQRHSLYQNNNNLIFSLNSKNISSHLHSAAINGENAGHGQSKQTKIDTKRESMLNSNQDNVKFETLSEKSLKPRGSNDNVMVSNGKNVKPQNSNNPEEDNKRISKTIQIHSTSQNNSPIKHSRTGKMSNGHNTNANSNPLENCPSQAKKTSSVKAAQRNWFFCCLPIK